MNPTHNNLRHSVILYKLVLFGCLLIPAQVYADIQKSELRHAGSSTVEELLSLDSRAALELARKQVFGESLGAATSGVPNDIPVLVAIYGTGRNLSAELLIAGRTVIYHSTDKQPVSGVPHGYKLERIAPPCVYLIKDQTQEIACMELRTP